MDQVKTLSEKRKLIDASVSENTSSNQMTAIKRIDDDIIACPTIKSFKENKVTNKTTTTSAEDESDIITSSLKEESKRIDASESESESNNQMTTIERSADDNIITCPTMLFIEEENKVTSKTTTNTNDKIDILSSTLERSADDNIVAFHTMALIQEKNKVTSKTTITYTEDEIDIQASTSERSVDDDIIAFPTMKSIQEENGVTSKTTNTNTEDEIDSLVYTTSFSSDGCDQNVYISFEEDKVTSKTTTTSAEDEIDILASTLEQEYDSTSLSSVSHENDDTSIKSHVANIEALIAGHELEDTKSKLEHAEKSIELQQSKLEEIESSLNEKEDVLSELKLERDLAEAEKRVMKQQLAALVNLKENLGVGVNTGAQFYPSDHINDMTYANPSAVRPNLLSCLQNQEDLHRIVVKKLHQKDTNERFCSPSAKPKIYCAPKTKCWYYFIHKSRKRMSQAQKKYHSFHSKMKLRRNNKSYQAVQDCYQEEILSLEEYSNSESDENSSWLVQEIKNFDAKNREHIHGIQCYMKSQSVMIGLLQDEVEKLMALQIACDDSTFTSSDGSSSLSSDSFFSICSE